MIDDKKYKVAIQVTIFGPSTQDAIWYRKTMSLLTSFLYKRKLKYLISTKKVKLDGFEDINVAHSLHDHDFEYTFQNEVK